jgi:hypothetical protein
VYSEKKDMKYCNKCGETKELSEFYKNKSKADGLHIYCKACSKKAKDSWRVQNKDKVAAYDKQWQAANKQNKAANYKKWQQNNKAKVNHINSLRRAAEKSATPSWANLEDIEAKYRLAKYFDFISGGFVKHHVDHVLPLRGKTVCGLHVENNLQVLIDKDNLRKSNKHYG